MYSSDQVLPYLPHGFTEKLVYLEWSTIFGSSIMLMLIKLTSPSSDQVLPYLAHEFTEKLVHLALAGGSTSHGSLVLRTEEECMIHV